MIQNFVTTEMLKTAMGNATLAALPVGTVIEIANDVSPAEVIGGTWERVCQGRVTVGSGGVQFRRYWRRGETHANSVRTRAASA